jgi:hypothetical protein
MQHWQGPLARPRTLELVHVRSLGESGAGGFIQKNAEVLECDCQ